MVRNPKSEAASGQARESIHPVSEPGRVGLEHSAATLGSPILEQDAARKDSPESNSVESQPLSNAKQTASRWRRSIDFIKDLGEIAKFVALLLVIAGFAGLYFPTLRTRFELIANPSAWYYIGKVHGGVFAAEPFQHPSWSGSSAPGTVLENLSGTTMVTSGGGLHIGRASAGGSQPIRTNFGGGVCLHVTNIERRFETGKPDALIWVEAIRITC